MRSFDGGEYISQLTSYLKDLVRLCLFYDSVPSKKGAFSLSRRVPQIGHPVERMMVMDSNLHFFSPVAHR